MKLALSIILLTVLLLGSCKLMHSDRSIPENKKFARLLNDYYNDRMKYFPLESTQNGESRYNDQLPVEFTDSYLDTLRMFFGRYRDKTLEFERDKLNAADQVSYDIFIREMNINLEAIDLHIAINVVAMPNVQYMPFNQFEGIPLSLGQMGSGSGIQPFKTVKDYQDWIKRASAFQTWTDSALVYFRRGIQNGYVLPRCLVEKMIPEMREMVKSDISQSIFYTPLTQMPTSFSEDDKTKIRADLSRCISESLISSYKRLSDFLETEYLPKSRATVGFYALPQGDKLYNFLIRYWTTTNQPADEIYETGLTEIKRIRTQIEAVKNETGYNGNLQSFFEFMKTDPRFTPFKTPEEVLAAYKKIEATIEPNLPAYFGKVPKMRFEIRQTEAFRAASASAEYVQGDSNGTRPGTFYIPILDATKYNVTTGMESLFLHEAIPGHHYQTALQIEDTLLPRFRRFGWYGAYGEGWALYAESLGKDLGLYRDPYQYVSALSNEMHRAIRLVVDVGMHRKKMTREEAIRFMMENEVINEQRAVAEIERYIGNPAQALSYKTGALMISGLRKRYEAELGKSFSLKNFHDEVLSGGCMPLEVLENKMDAWEMAQ